MNKNEDCQYCCGDVDSRDYLLSDGCDGVYIDGNNNLSGDDKYDFEDIKINYCPICGRKLLVNVEKQEVKK